MRNVACDQRRLGDGESAECHQIGLVHRGGNRDDLVGNIERGLGVTAAHRRDRGRNQQHAPRRNRYVASQFLDDAFGACHPPTRLRHVPAHHQCERRPARAQRGPVGTTAMHVLAMRPLPGPNALLVTPNQVRRHGEHLEHVRVEVLSRVGEQRVHLEPRVPTERFARSLHRANRRPPARARIRGGGDRLSANSAAGPETSCCGYGTCLSGGFGEPGCKRLLVVACVDAGGVARVGDLDSCRDERAQGRVDVERGEQTFSRCDVGAVEYLRQDIGVESAQALCKADFRTAPTTLTLSTERSWSWGESNPRPSVGERTRYDHSRPRT